MILMKENLNKVFEILSQDSSLLLPMNIDGIAKFAPYGSGEPNFEMVNTMMPPKDALFPQTEKMYSYKLANKKTELKDENIYKDQVIFGIRSCDMQSLACMDDVFLTRGFVDEFYSKKREALTTVAIGCNKVAETCFCDSMGLDPQKSAADVQLKDVGSGYTVTAQSPKGEALVAKIQGLLRDGDVLNSETAKVECTLKVELRPVVEKLPQMFEHPIWETESKKCIGCGTCTFICPTCHCFDIDTQKSGNEGYQFRCWDSCMFSEYTRMAGGANPRPSKKERLRNRFMHKLLYFEQRYGKPLCVGCGRCVAKCPVDVDITTLIDKLGEVQINE